MFTIQYAVKSIMRRKQKNLITAFAIALGVSLFIGTQAASSGLYDTVLQINLELTGNNDITIVNPASPNGLMDPGVINLIEAGVASNPVLQNIQTISSRISYASSVYYPMTGQLEAEVEVHGIIPDEEGFQTFYDLAGNSINLAATLVGNGTMISKTLQEAMDLNINDGIQMNVPDGLGNLNTITLQISNIFDITRGRGRVYSGGPGDAAKSNLYINLASLQAHLNPLFTGYFTDIQIVVDGVKRGTDTFDLQGKTFPGKDKIDAIMDELDLLFTQDFGDLLVYSRINIIADNTLTELSGLTSVLTLFAIMLNGVALLLIINVQSMAVDDRKAQTAVLRALGSNVSTIFMVFLFEALIIGLLGAVIGLFIGLGISLWILSILSTVFEVEIASGGFSVGLIATASIAGIVISILTAVVPSMNAARMAVAQALRGVKEEEAPRKGYLTLIFGLTLLPLGMSFATQVGNLTEDSTWWDLDDQLNIALGLGLTLAGIGLLLTLILSRRIALTISGVSLFGLGVFFLTWAISKAKTGDGGNLLSIILLFMIVGSTMLVSEYYGDILNGVSKLLFTLTGLRAISQVTTKQMIGKKNRGILVYTILTVILVLIIFIGSAADTQRISVVNSYENFSNGIDIVVSTDTALPGTKDRIASINDRVDNLAEVTEVYGFRRSYLPIYMVNPDDDDFDISTDLVVMPIVEIPSPEINRDNWGERSYPIRLNVLSKEMESETGQNINIKTTQNQQKTISGDVFDQFFNGYTREKAETHVQNGTRFTAVETQQMVIQGFFVAFIHLDLLVGNTVYLKGTSDETIPVFLGAETRFDMLGTPSFPLYSNALLVPTSIASLLPFETVNPNVFLVRSNNGYHETDENDQLAKSIETDLNNLNDPKSFSSNQNPATLVGASTSNIKDVVQRFFYREASFWDFLRAFSTMGLFVGTLGMMIIAVRSVSERTREIGMMRSIGFSKQSVVYGVLIEMLVISIMSLIVGIFMAVIFSESFADSLFGVKAIYPMGQIFGYVFGLLLLAIISAVIPGYRASKVAPSHALRYTG